MNENLSDFLKNAYKHNKVKDLKEAFEEYPVEEEWHDVIYKILNEQIIFKIGKVDEEKIEEYKKSFNENI